MREGTVFAILVNPQIPDNGCEQDNRGFHKEVTLFLNPGLVQIQEYGVGRFVSVGYVHHEFRVDGIAAVAASRVVKIYHVEFRSDPVLVNVFKQFVIGNDREVIKFVIVQI